MKRNAVVQSFKSLKVQISSQISCGNLTYVKPQPLKEGAGVTFTLRGLFIQLAAQLRLYGTVAAGVKLIGSPRRSLFSTPRAL